MTQADCDAIESALAEHYAFKTDYTKTGRRIRTAVKKAEKPAPKVGAGKKAKVKKLKKDATFARISLLVGDPDSIPDGGAAAYSEKFEACVKAHPEFSKVSVERMRSQLEKDIARPAELERLQRNAKAWVDKKLAGPLGECEMCDDSTPATERIVTATNVSNYCAKCAEEQREYDRKDLIRRMSVQKCYNPLFSWKRLRDVREEKDDGNGGTYVPPNKPDYLDWLKEEFLGNERYDQATVKDYMRQDGSEAARE